MSGLVGAVDPGLLERFRRAGPAIAWRSAGRGRSARRVAHLHDEEAVVALREDRSGATITVEPGPVGALVLLLEIDQRGPAAGLWASDSGAAPFARGSLSAAWATRPTAPPGGRSVPLGDLVALARYALV